MSDRKVIVLLTATINPGATPFVVRNSPSIRMTEYKDALNSWILHGGASRIIVCENSGAELAELKMSIPANKSPNVEFVSYVDLKSGPTRGKGYAELGEIERVLSCVNNIALTDVVVKCTGRLIVRNGAELLRRVAHIDFDVMCDLRKYLTYADTRIFAATREFLENYLIQRRETVNDNSGIYLEHALAAAVGTGLANGKKWRPFPLLPQIVGVSGTTGKSMTDPVLKGVARRTYYRLIDRVYRR